MKNILILGGTGYIGNFLQTILSKSHNVVAVGKTTEKKFVIGKKFDNTLLEKIDIVIYLSWLFDFHDKNYHQKNLDAFEEVSILCAQNKIKLVFFSTFYASSQSNSIYNKAKAECESIALNFNFPVVRLGSVIIEGYDPGGFYGNIISFTEKYRLFPIFLPDYKKFYLTNSDDLILFCHGLFNLDNGINYLCSQSPAKLYDLFEFSNKKIIKIYIPWKLVFWFLRFFENLGIKLKFHSQSLISIWGEKE